MTARTVIQFVELPEPLREGGLEKAAADMAKYLSTDGVEVRRGNDPVTGLNEADIVHFHGLWSPAHARLARQAEKRGLPAVVSPHGMLEPWAWRHRRWKKWPYFHLVEKHRLRRASALLATAEEEKQNLQRFFPSSRIETIPLGIEPDVTPGYASARAELGWDPGERVLLYLSRVHPKKGLKELLEALMQIDFSESPPVRLVIVGDGPEDYMNTCRGLSRQLEARIPVDWVPPQWGDGKWPYLKGADLFCLPTYSENFGIVVLEAGMVGTPVFTTTGTPWKVIEKAGYGWVPDPDPELYAGTLRSFLELSDEGMQSMRAGIAGWTREHYSWPMLAGRYAAFYHRLLSEALHSFQS